MKFYLDNRQTTFLEPLIIDYFAGGGGASTGIELALGRSVDIAVNHDDRAIQLHEVNHPFTKHYCESVFDVDLNKECQGRHVTLFWLSPDCTHFSKARGGTPVKKEIRGLAWIAVRAAHDARPDVIMLENVEEILTWGKLRAKRDPKTGRVLKVSGEVAASGEVVAAKDQVMEPDPKHRGKLWKKFIKTLQGLGYECEWKIIKACDYGAPTSRKRLFAIFRCDGLPIVWPEATHGAPDSEGVKSGKLLAWRTAAECIDFNKEAPSIFARKKPLAENTLKRITRGIDKFVIKSRKPFIIPVGYGERKGQAPRVNDIENPLGTAVSTAKHNIVMPTITKFQQNSIGQAPVAPIDTIMSGATRFGIVAHTLTALGQTGFKSDRIKDIREPLNTIVSKNESCLVSSKFAPFVADHQHKNIGIRADEPHQTICGVNKSEFINCKLAPIVGSNNYENKGSSPESPLPTITTQNNHHCLFTPVLTHYHSATSEKEARGMTPDAPIPTIDTSNRHALAVGMLSKAYGGNYNGAGSELKDPVHTITSQDHNNLVTAYIQKYYGNPDECGTKMQEPIHTLTSKDRMSYVSSNLTILRNGMDGSDVNAPIPTITAGGGHIAECRTFLARYTGGEYGYWPQIRDMLNAYGGYNLAADEIILFELSGDYYYLSDVGMRMLDPEELKLAQGFPADYVIDHDKYGNPYPKTEQVAKIGNSVCPQVPFALVHANLAYMAADVILQTMSALNQRIAITA